MRIHFIQHIASEYPGSLLSWARDQQHAVSFTNVYEHMDFPSDDQFDVLISLGGPMGVYEDEQYEWIQKEKILIAAAMRTEKKIMGICLGSQLIANVLGARVYPHAVKEIGWLPVFKTAEHPFTRQLPQEFISFHLHGDTFSLPAGAKPLLSSSACEQQGFAYGENVLALQFHPEIEPGLLENMIEQERESFLPAATVQSEQVIRDLATEYLPAQPCYMRTLIENLTGG